MMNRVWIFAYAGSLYVFGTESALISALDVRCFLMDNVLLLCPFPLAVALWTEHVWSLSGCWPLTACGLACIIGF